MKAMIRCQEYLDRVNSLDKQNSFYMVMQVHDEIVFDFPNYGIVWGGGPGAIKEENPNLVKIRNLVKLMEQSGDDIGIPLTVSAEYHADNWSEGVEI